jgi:hypothetical protein
VARSWPGYVAPLVAAVLTLLLVWIQDVALQAAVAAGDSISPVMLLAGLLGLGSLFLVPALWSGALLASRPWFWALAAALAWLAVSLGISPALAVWPLAGYVAAGLAAGWALARRWRLDVALAVVTVALAPYTIWSFGASEPEKQFSLAVDQYIEARREMLEGTADPRQIELTLDAERRGYEQSLDLVLKVLPATFGLGLIGLAGVLLFCAGLAGRLLGMKVGLARLPRFGHWRLPFYLVWILVAGLGLVITRQAVLTAAGMNLALAVGTLLSLQGAAVQWELTGRTMGQGPRLIYLLVAGFLFLPLVLLGLADQWLDFRKLETSHPEGPPEDSDGADKGAPADDADEAGKGDR